MLNEVRDKRFPRPSLDNLREAFQQGQRDQEQGWVIGADLWGFEHREASDAYWLGVSQPRVTPPIRPRQQRS